MMEYKILNLYFIANLKFAVQTFHNAVKPIAQI